MIKSNTAKEKSRMQPSGQLTSFSSSATTLKNMSLAAFPEQYMDQVAIGCSAISEDTLTTVLADMDDDEVARRKAALRAAADTRLEA